MSSYGSCSVAPHMHWNLQTAAEEKNVILALAKAYKTGCPFAWEEMFHDGPRKCFRVSVYADHSTRQPDGYLEKQYSEVDSLVGMQSLMGLAGEIISCLDCFSCLYIIVWI